MKHELFESIVDLNGIAGQLLVLYEGFYNDGFSASNETLASAVDGMRRYLGRVIEDLEDLDQNYELTPRNSKGAAIA